ncbi:hypothetical protein P171DRAFT_433849 [Karstenula rhodostoma CBS 690.94]|uniref:Uncharacterized protein n=1 Tax=Karstenula rhodostoma CBS 690.94 TaxID=1392251 RepID=A0A9P4PE49_9PLEO|nr:hypothetical protein P171DRAFT_433849 [Karstenula rhodostoma CBS 690.94]
MSKRFHLSKVCRATYKETRLLSLAGAMIFCWLIEDESKRALEDILPVQREAFSTLVIDYSDLCYYSDDHVGFVQAYQKDLSGLKRVFLDVFWTKINPADERADDTVQVEKAVKLIRQALGEDIHVEWGWWRKEDM